MTNATRVDIVFLALHEIMIGLAAGLGGVVVTGLIISQIEPLIGLFESIMYPCIVGLVCMIGGIGIVGYQYLRQHKEGPKFTKQLLQALLGVALGFVISWCLTLLFKNFLPLNGIVYTTIMALPLVGLLTGFNHRIRYTFK